MEFNTIKTLAEFQALGNEWNELLNESAIRVPFLRHEYLVNWWQTLGGGEWTTGELNIITARQDQALIGIAPLFLTKNQDGQPALMLLGSIEISDFLDVIARSEHLAEFLDEMSTFLEQSVSHWQVLDWYNVLSDSPTLAALKTAASQRGWQYKQEIYQPSPHIILPGNWEKYLLEQVDKKQRHEIRRKMRRAEQNDIPIRWYIVEDRNNLEAEVDTFLSLMEQDHHKEHFLTPQMRVSFHATAQAAFDNGWLQLAFLTINGKKACGYFNFDYENQIWVYNSGLDFRFREYSPGWVLLGYLLQWANEHQRQAFDFMRGNEDYKYRFGAVNRQVIRVKVEK